MYLRVMAVLVTLLAVLPAFAKSNKDLYPVACTELWAAVHDTLGNPANYTVQVIDDEKQTALFTVTGATRVLLNSLALAPENGGCRLDLKIKNTDFAINDEGAFRKRLDRSLTRVEAPRAAPGQPGPPR